MPEYAGPDEWKIDSLGMLILVGITIGFIVTVGVLIVAIVRYRSGKGIVAHYFDGGTWRSFKWVGMGMLGLALTDFTIMIYEHPTWVSSQEEIPTEGFRVGIIGRQWAWVYQYPGPDGILYTDDDVIVDEPGASLHVPAGKNVIIDISSRDVIHSVFIPHIRFKYDAIPGRTIRKWFRIEKEGKYPIACAELCGDLHYMMVGWIEAHNEADFNRYIQEIYSKKGT